MILAYLINTDVNSPYGTYNTDKKDELIHFTFYKTLNLKNY